MPSYQLIIQNQYGGQQLIGGAQSQPALRQTVLAMPSYGGGKTLMRIDCNGAQGPWHAIEWWKWAFGAFPSYGANCSWRWLIQVGPAGPSVTNGYGLAQSYPPYYRR